MDIQNFLFLSLTGTSLGASLLIGMFWFDRKRAFLKVVSSFGGAQREDGSFLWRYAFRASFALLFCIALDIIVGLAIVFQFSGFQTIASILATSLTMLVGIFYLLESISFFRLVGNILKHAQNMQEGHSKGVQRMASIARLFFYDAIAMILLALVFAAAVPIGGALWSPSVWPFWWGAMLFLRWSISALQSWICVMHGNIRTRDHVVTQKKIELGSRHPSSTVLPSGTAHSAETDESSASDMAFTP